MDPNMPKWIFSSLAQHFETVSASVGLNYFVEGVMEEEKKDFQKDSALFRMDGPEVRTGAGSEEWYRISVQILLTNHMSRTTKNSYVMHERAGAFQASLLRDPLRIIKMGGLAGDDRSFIGCLSPDPSVRTHVTLSNFAIVDRDLRIRQMSLTGKFILEC